MILFIICVMIILNPKQFRGLPMSDLQNSSRYLHDGSHCCFRPWLFFNFLHLSYTPSPAELLLLARLRRLAA